MLGARVLLQQRNRAAAMMERALLRQRNDLLCQAPSFLGLHNSGLDAPLEEETADLVGHHHASVLPATTDLKRTLSVTHVF